METPTTPILRPLKAVRAKCIDCCCGQMPEVRLCPSKTCALWLFRMGHRPDPTEVKEATAALEKAHGGKETGAKQ